MNIKLRTDYPIFDASDPEDLSKVISGISIAAVPVVTLDLSGCIIDYPSTALLTDHIFEQIAARGGAVKQMNIIHDYPLEKKFILNSLFLGSKFFGLQSKKPSSFEDLESCVSARLTEIKVRLSISLIDGNGKVQTEFPYGT